jgi:hypothetical protein
MRTARQATGGWWRTDRRAGVLCQVEGRPIRKLGAPRHHKATNQVRRLGPR